MTPFAFIIATLTGTLPIPAAAGTRKFRCADSPPKPKTLIGCRKARVHAYKRPDGVKPHLTREQIAEIVARFRLGESRSSIAQRFDIHPRTAARIYARQTKE